jgi:CHAT domain-containing protein/predicted negative regulator of RcsB-dependent stress response
MRLPWMVTAAPPTRTRPRPAGLALIGAILLAGCARDPLRTVDALLAEKKPEKALESADVALRRSLAGERLFWELALRKAESLKELNRREEALQWFRSLGSALSAPADLSLLLLRDQAAIEADLGQYRDADQHLRAGISLARDSRQARMAAVLDIRLARVLIRQDKTEDVEESLADAENYARGSNDHEFDPYILHYRGLARLATNRFEEAIAPLEESLQKFRQTRQNPLAANVIVSLAWCYYRLGRPEKALELYREALSIAATDDRHLVLGHLGNISYDQHDYTQAAAYYQQAAAGAKGRDQYYYSKWLDNLAIALIEQGRWREAEPFNNEALKLEAESSVEVSPAMVTSGRIQARKGNYPAAERTLQQVAQSRGNIAIALDAYAGLADLYARMNKPAEVKRQFEAALALADQTRENLREDENKLSYLASLIDVHRQFVDFLMEHGEEAAAFAAAESSRARLLRERLDLPRSRPRSYTIAEYQAAARTSGATFLAYWIGPQRSYLWAIAATQFRTYPLPPEAEIRSLVERYQQAVESGGAARGDSAAGAQLFQLLLAKNSGVLKPGGRYLIVPDGPLYALNFETLPVGGDRPHYWIEDATVALAPSLNLLLARPVAAPEPGRSLLLVGDAAEWNREFPRLLFARQEMDGIAKEFSARPRTVLLGAEATPAAYQHSEPGQYSYIHFAAHATANKNSPFDSAIILSREDRAPSGPGKLSVKEVLSTRVRAELVTISACNSAGARTYGGEGLVGFAWAFLQSGAHGVIAGLWDVSDYASPRLMQDLYAGLAASQRPADALRSAKLQLLTGGKYSHPYYWGAFQLYEGTLYPQRQPSPTN